MYVGGDRQPNNNGFPNAIGANDFTGRLFRCDATPGRQQPMHAADAQRHREQQLAARRLAGDDVRRQRRHHRDGRRRDLPPTDPSTTNGAWQSLNGNLQISEHQSCDYDSVGDLILCGDQDTGAPEQSAAGSLSWLTLSAGDGGFVAVNDAGADSVRFSSSNNLGAGGFLRRTCTPANVCVNSAPGFNVVGQGQTIQQFEQAGGQSTLPLYTPLFINEIDGTRFIVTSSRIYESTDSLDNLTIILNALGGGGSTRAIAYGGRSAGADNEDVLWVGDASGQLWLRSGGLGAPTVLPGWTNGVAVDIVLNPEEWTDAFVTNGTSVFRTTDAGATFSEHHG